MTKSKITVELTLKDGSKLVLDKSKIKNIESLSQTNADASTIFYGVLASSGRLEILDYDGTIKKYINEGIIDTSSIKVDIYINGVLTQSHISSNSNYANESSIMTIELTNKLSLWDTINYGGYYYPEKPETAYEMLKNILISVGYEEDYIDDIMLSDTIFAEDNTEKSIRDYLDSIKIEYPYLPSDTLRATIDKFCTLAQLNVVLDNNGEIKFVSARPLIQNTKNVIQIPLSRQYGDFTYSVILKNKYDAVEIDKYNVESKQEIKTTVYSAYLDQLDSFEQKWGLAHHALSGSPYIHFGAAAYISSNYSGGSIIVPKKSNYNLNKITKIYIGKDSSGDFNIKYYLQYDKKTSRNAEAILHVETESELYITEYNDNIENIETGTGEIDQELEVTEKYEWETSRYKGTLTATAEIDNRNNFLTLKYTNNDLGDYLFDNIILLSSKTTRKMRGGYQPPAVDVNPTGLPRDINLTGEVEIISAIDARVDFLGDITKITFSEKSASSDNINSATNPVSIETSELFSDKTKVNGIEITDIVKSNILSDYSEGISNGTLTVAATNYFDKDGNKVVDISKGQTIKVGDVVNIEGDNRRWRVTGANQRKGGTPYIDLEVMEVKQVPLKEYKLTLNTAKTNVTITRVSSKSENAKIGTIKSDDILYAGDVLKFNATKDSSFAESELQYIKINSPETGELIDYINNSEYIVNRDIIFEAVTYSWETLFDYVNVTGFEYSTDEKNSIFNYYDSRIIANRSVRVTGKPTLTASSGYYINPNIYYYGFESDYGDSELDVTDTHEGGTVLGTIKFSLQMPTEDGKLPYKNYTSLGSVAYLSGLAPFKLEQFR